MDTRAPLGAAHCHLFLVISSRRVDEGRKGQSLLVIKMKGKDRSGEGGEGPAMWPGIFELRLGGRKKRRANGINGMKNKEKKYWYSSTINASRSNHFVQDQIHAKCFRKKAMLKVVPLFIVFCTETLMKPHGSAAKYYRMMKAKRSKLQDDRK